MARPRPKFGTRSKAKSRANCYNSRLHIFLRRQLDQAIRLPEIFPPLHFSALWRSGFKVGSISGSISKTQGTTLFVLKPKKFLWFPLCLKPATQIATVTELQLLMSVSFVISVDINLGAVITKLC